MRNRGGRCTAPWLGGDAGWRQNGERQGFAGDGSGPSRMALAALKPPLQLHIPMVRRQQRALGQLSSQSLHSVLLQLLEVAAWDYPWKCVSPKKPCSGCDHNSLSALDCSQGVGWRDGSAHGVPDVPTQWPKSAF